MYTMLKLYQKHSFPLEITRLISSYKNGWLLIPGSEGVCSKPKLNYGSYV